MVLPTLTLFLIISPTQLLATPQTFDLPSADIYLTALKFVKTIHGHMGLWNSDIEGPQQSHAVRGLLKPCDALRQAFAGIGIEVIDADTGQLLCRPPPIRRIKASPLIIDPPRPSCECLAFGDIPIPLCENDEHRFEFAHGRCASDY